MSEERTLSAYENQKLGSMGLSPKQDTAVRAMWASENEMKKHWWSPLVELLTPILVAIFIANTVAPSQLFTSLASLAVVVTWVGYIFFVTPVMAIGSICIMAEVKNAHPLGHMGMLMARGTGKGKKLWRRLISIALIIVLAMSGHMITAVATAVAYVFYLVVVYLAKTKVEESLKEVEQTA